jgi:hypothetical protein
MENKVRLYVNHFDDITLGDNIVISDPCYNRSVDCALFNVKVKSGKYLPYTIINSQYNRVTLLGIFHSEYFKNIYQALDRSEWEYFGEIGVDSGQAGIFDDNCYPILDIIGKYKDDMIEMNSEEFDIFYNECCTITTLPPIRSNVLSNRMGIVSSSGWGDGSYSVIKLEIKNEIVGLMILYTDLKDLDWKMIDKKLITRYINWEIIENNNTYDPFIEWMNKEINFAKECLKKVSDKDMFSDKTREIFSENFVIKTMEEYKKEYDEKQKEYDILYAIDKTNDIRKRSKIIKNLIEKAGE